jgi:hypothetical protein
MLPAEHVWAYAGLFQGLYMYLHVPACIKGLVALRAGHVSACLSTYQELVMYLHVLAHIKC